ncbi:MAG: cupin domain-containing protein [Ferruginibacter sp.]
MKNLKSFIETGILELYVAGNATREEMEMVEQMADEHDEVRLELEVISEVFESYAFSHAIVPAQTVRPFLMANIDFRERLKNGEQPSNPPELNEHSSLDDYSEWLQRSDMYLPSDFRDLHAKIIGYTPKAITAIVWIKQQAPQEQHDNELERFLIVEGTCNIVVEQNVYSLKPGDYFAIPLHKTHHVEITSSIPCKVILQRLAA